MREIQPNDERLLRVEDVADRLAIGRRKAYELVSSGSIPSLRIGRVIRVSTSDLEAWIRAQVRAPRDE